jgi:hypothetical protein
MRPARAVTWRCTTISARRPFAGGPLAESGESFGGAPTVLNEWIQQKRRAAHGAYVATLPLVTAETSKTPWNRYQLIQEKTGF